MIEKEYFYVAGIGPVTGIPDLPLLVEGRQRAMKIVSDHLGTLSDREKEGARRFLEGSCQWFRTKKAQWISDGCGYLITITIQKVKMVP